MGGRHDKNHRERAKEKPPRKEGFVERDVTLVRLNRHQIRDNQVAVGIFEAHGNLLRVSAGGDVNAVHTTIARADVHLRTIKRDAAGEGGRSTRIWDYSWRRGLQVEVDKLR